MALQWSIFQLYSTIVSGVSILLNAFLLLLSANKTVDTIQELRYFLSNISVAGILFSVANVLLQPQMVVRGPITIRVPHGIAAHWQDNVVKAVAGVAITAYIYNLLSFPVFFIYRLVTFSNNVVYGHYFTKRNMIFAFIVVFLFSTMEGVFFYFSNVDYESLFYKLNKTSDALDQFVDTNERHLEILYSTTPYSTGDTENNGGMMQTANDWTMLQAERNSEKRVTLFGDDYSRNPIMFLFLGIALFVHLLSYCIVLNCSYFMLKALQKKAATISFQARMAHQVLVHAIFAEAFLPLVISVPIFANSILCFVYTDSLVWQEYLLEYFIAIVPLFNPIISIAFIQPYREAALNYITCGYKGRKDAETRDKELKAREDAEQAREIARELAK